MSAWPPFKPSTLVDLAAVGPLAPAEVLYEFDGPCIFTALTTQRPLVLAYLSEELDDGRLRYVVATTSEATISAMKDGAVSVREAIERGSLWVVDFDRRYRPQEAHAVQLSELPADAFPPSTVMLW